MKKTKQNKNKNKQKKKVMRFGNFIKLFESKIWHKVEVFDHHGPANDEIGQSQDICGVLKI